MIRLKSFQFKPVFILPIKYYIVASDEGFDNKMESNSKLKRVRRGLVEENIRLRKQVR